MSTTYFNMIVLPAAGASTKVEVKGGGVCVICARGLAIRGQGDGIAPNTVVAKIYRTFDDVPTERPDPSETVPGTVILGVRSTANYEFDLVESSSSSSSSSEEISQEVPEAQCSSQLPGDAANFLATWAEWENPEIIVRAVLQFKGVCDTKTECQP